jgi:hypothetical protein
MNMKDEFILSEDDDYTCQTQAELYEYVKQNGYDIVSFSDKYLVSDFCNREMDSEYSVFQREDPLQILDFVIPQIGDLVEPVDDGVYVDAYDLGYLYRYLHFSTGLSSREIVEKIDTKSMIKELSRRTDWNIDEVAKAVASTYDL